MFEAKIFGLGLNLKTRAVGLLAFSYHFSLIKGAMIENPSKRVVCAINKKEGLGRKMSQKGFSFFKF